MKLSRTTLALMRSILKVSPTVALAYIDDQGRARLETIDAARFKEIEASNVPPEWERPLPKDRQ